MNEHELSEGLSRVTVPGAPDAEDQAVRLARSAVGDRRNSSRHSTRRTVMAVAGAALLVAFAFTPPGGALADQLADLVGADDSTPEPISPALPGSEYLPPPGAPAVEDVEPAPAPNHISAHEYSPEEVADCRRVLAEGRDGPEAARLGGCQIIVAKAEGALDPGWYSDSDLEAALRRAGVLP